jgi:beta-N-acetylhexosaminidase
MLQDRVGVRTVCAVVAVAAMSMSCAGRAGEAAPLSPTTAAPHPTASHTVAPPTTAVPSPRAMTSKLSNAQLAGQRVVYSYRGKTPPAALFARIRRGEAAGVMFFKDNISSRSQIHQVITELQEANRQSPVRAPLLMMTDQEGGLVRRLPGAPYLSAEQVGAASHPVTAAQQAGASAGQNLRGVGMNVNLAPVLDVYRTAGDFDDQYHRSFSQNPKTVAALGAAFIEAQQRTGVAATAKHFPGLGTAGAQQNTDKVPVTLHVPVRTLRAVDELPYQAAIEAGAKLIMVSWARYPSLDPDRPAGLSPTIVQGELRRRFGFQGVTITDALEAGGLKAFGSTSRRGVLAAGAGMDLLLYSAENVSEGINGLNALVTALRSGRLNSANFRASAERVMALRASLGT